jgi:hypothetical protein
MARTEYPSAPHARAAGHQIEPLAADIAFGGHLRPLEESNALRHSYGLPLLGGLTLATVHTTIVAQLV